MPEEEWSFDPDPARIAQMLNDTAIAVHEAIKSTVETRRDMKVHYDHPILLLQHMLWHDGYHHGQIKLALNMAGCPITDQEAGPLTWDVFIGAGAIVTKNVPDYALILGNPGHQIGWVSRHGHRLRAPDTDRVIRCPESGFRNKEVQPGLIRCLDLDENEPLPAHLSRGAKSYDTFKTESALIHQT